jgi:CheY-like chemotaxis protein
VAPASIRSVAVVVADDPTRRAIREALDFPDLKVYDVGSVADFHQVLSESVPDLVIVDYELPEQRGFDLCRDLRDDPRTRRISILCLLPPQGVDVEECVVAGINDFLARPVDPGEVVRKVDRLTRVPDRKRLNTLALIRPDGGEATHLGRAVNVSPTGILLEVEAALPVGGLCELRFNLPGQSEPVRARGVVRRRAREVGATAGGFGVEFASLGPEDRGRLHRFFEESGEGGR